MLESIYKGSLRGTAQNFNKEESSLKFSGMNDPIGIADLDDIVSEKPGLPPLE